MQKICLKILRHEKITFGKEKDKVYGLLFDGAWLWEEYLNTILKENFIHPENKTGKHRHYLFENNIQSIFPDFISKVEPKSVGDAKYIPLDRQQSYSENSEKATSIYYKTIAYKDFDRFILPVAKRIFATTISQDLVEVKSLGGGNSGDEIKKAKKEDIALILSSIYKWKDAWKTSNINEYLSFYSKDFKRADRSDFNTFANQKKQIFAKNENKIINLYNMDISPYPNSLGKKIYRAVMDEEYYSPSVKFVGKKELFIEVANNKVQILTED